jgi:hypothetical protein
MNHGVSIIQSLHFNEEWKVALNKSGLAKSQWLKAKS